MAADPRPGAPASPVLGRPSPASAAPARLRACAAGPTASYQADGGDSDGWSLRAASVAGVRHRLAGEASQDAWCWSASPDLVVAAVADGVGGVAGSGAAATAAVGAVAAAAAGALAGAGAGAGALAGAGARDLAAWMDEVFEVADAAVRAAGGASTLVVAAVRASGEAAVARIGDSAAMVVSRGGLADVFPAVPAPDPGHGTAGARPAAHGCADPAGPSTAGPGAAGEPAGPSAAGEPAANVTDALPASPIAPEHATALLGAGDALVLASDGIIVPLHDGPRTVAPAFAAALASPPAPLALAALVDFSRQGCFDDRTLVVLWPPGVPR